MTEYMNEWMRKKRLDRRKRGLCVVCGARPVDNGFVSCRACLDSGKLRSKKRYLRDKSIYSVKEKE